MARLFGDENFDVQAMTLLQSLGHDVLTAKDAEMINQRISDQDVLHFATNQERAVVTFDRRDYYRLHKENPTHSGIIACTYDANSQALAERIHESIDLESNDLANKFLRIYRPNI
ncbi:MAG: DUF5615 family PIN-like protein [Saprospiraceae bacterium]|jgi:hypothetical protein